MVIFSTLDECEYDVVADGNIGAVAFVAVGVDGFETEKCLSFISFIECTNESDDKDLYICIFLLKFISGYFVELLLDIFPRLLIAKKSVSIFDATSD